MSPRDQLAEAVAEILDELLANGDTVSPLDLLVALELIKPEAVEAWRSGQLPYLERGVTVGIVKVHRALAALEAEARLRKLVVLQRPYRSRRGKLRCSKSGERSLEVAYARHYRRPAVPHPT
jgi:hypothetical protein